MSVKNQILFKTTGKYGLFTDPITKLGGEKCSYQIPTYEALKGIVKSIYWKPSIIWVIDEIRILNPIRTQSKNMKPLRYNDATKADLAIYNYLIELEYEVKAHFIFNSHRPEFKDDWQEGKHYNIAKRMIKKGGRRDVCLGSRECQAYVEEVDNIDPTTGFSDKKGFYDDIDELAFGFMFRHFSYPDETGINQLEANFHIPIMKNGIIKYDDNTSEIKTKFIREMIPNLPKSQELNEQAIQNELA